MRTHFGLNLVDYSWEEVHNLVDECNFVAVEEAEYSDLGSSHCHPNVAAEVDREQCQS